MFTRTLRAGRRRATYIGVQANKLSPKVPRRRYSNATPTPVSDATPSPVAALGGLTSELDKISPRFDVDASQITILKDPSEFYETLKASPVLYLNIRFSLVMFLSWKSTFSSDIVKGQHVSISLEGWNKRSKKHGCQ